MIRAECVRNERAQRAQQLSFATGPLEKWTEARGRELDDRRGSHETPKCYRGL